MHTRQRRLLLTITTLIVAVLGIASTMATPNAYAGPVSTGWGCANTQVVAVPGTWETSPSNNPRSPVGLLKGVTDLLDDRSTSINYIPYTARMVDTDSMINSWQSGFAEMNRAVAQLADQCPRSDFVFLGFSQGAGITGDVATSIGQGTGPISADRVSRIALVADPLRSEGSPMPAGSTGYTDGGGIIGVRSVPDFGALKGRVQSICKKRDYICNVNQTDTIIPNLAAHFTGVSLSDPNTVITALIGALQSLGLQDVANLAISVLSGQKDLVSGLFDMPKAIMGSFGTMGTQLQVPMDLNVSDVSGAALGNINALTQLMRGDPQRWGVIGQNETPLLSYLYRGINGKADFLARVAASLAQIGQITNEVHNISSYNDLKLAGEVPTPQWIADWVNPTLSGDSLLSFGSR